MPVAGDRSIEDDEIIAETLHLRKLDAHSREHSASTTAPRASG
jgi:hypothetical protein